MPSLASLMIVYFRLSWRERPDPKPSPFGAANFTPNLDRAHVLPDEKAKEEILAFTPKSSSQHRYLQTLIKRMAQEKGFRVIVEEATPSKDGRVDVGLLILCLSLLAEVLTSSLYRSYRSVRHGRLPFAM